MDSSILLVLAAFACFLPSWVGYSTRHAGGIFALNLFLGWTVLGWVGALVWALTSPEKDKAAEASALPPTPPRAGAYCGECGVAVRQEVKFCERCGTPRPPPD